MSRRSLILASVLFSLLVAGPVQAQGAGTEPAAPAVAAAPAATSREVGLPSAYHPEAPGVRGFYERNAEWAWLQAIVALLVIVPFIARGVARIDDDLVNAPTRR